MFHLGDHRRELLKGTRRHGGFRFPEDKFLRSRLGRLWSEVHAELSKEFDRRTYSGYRFWSNFNSRYNPKVATKVWIGAETGIVYQSREGRFESNSSVDGFYAHPWTGKLCFQERIIQPRINKECICRKNIRIPITDRTYIEKIEGIWYWSEYVIAYGEQRIDKKRQLDSKSLAANKISNDQVETTQRQCDACCLMNGYHALINCVWCPSCEAWLCAMHRADLYCRQEFFYRRNIIRQEAEKAKEQGEYGNLSSNSVPTLPNNGV